MGHQQFLRGVSVYIVDILLFLLVVAKKNKGCFLVNDHFKKIHILSYTFTKLIISQRTSVLEVALLP